MANSSQSTGHERGQLAGHPPHGRVQPQPGLDADDHQVERVGKAQEDRPRPASSCGCPPPSPAGRNRAPGQRCHGQGVAVMPNLRATIGKAIPSPRSIRISLTPKKTATAFSLAEAGVEQLEPDLAQLLLVGRAERLARACWRPWSPAAGTSPAGGPTCSSASFRPRAGFMIRLQPVLGAVLAVGERAREWPRPPG